MNRVHVVTLGVSDMDRALGFYRDGLGFETSVIDLREEGCYDCR